MQWQFFGNGRRKCWPWRCRQFWRWNSQDGDARKINRLERQSIVTLEQLAKIRKLEDFDLIMLISEIRSRQVARRTLAMMPEPREIVKQ